MPRYTFRFILGLAINTTYFSPVVGLIIGASLFDTIKRNQYPTCSATHALLPSALITTFSGSISSDTFVCVARVDVGMYREGARISALSIGQNSDIVVQ